MRAPIGAVLCASLILLGAVAEQALAAVGEGRRSERLIAASDPSLVLTSSGTAARFKSAGPDTFSLYGGPGSVLGKFQAGMPPGGTQTPDAQGWTHRDVTDQPTLWQLHSFNSPTGTQCMWAGQTAAQQPGWATSPGYGNSWNALLTFRTTVSNPAAGQTVGLDFVFNHDSEGGYDYFDVEYDSAGFSKLVHHRDGNNKDSGGNFVPLSYAAVAANPIRYAGNDYAGDSGDEIVIRLAARSDGAWSDEDGLHPSDGFVQVDDITVTHLDGTEGPEDFDAGPFLWIPEKAPFAGDFSAVFGYMTDLDPCRDNPTAMIGFIDDGNGPYNPTYFGTGTGGTTSNNWTGVYGVPGGWVVNYNGGISAGALDLDNEWWSPEIDWDLDSGVTDSSDDYQVAGALIRFTVWEHLPLLNGLFHTWGVRGHDPSTGWSQWDSRNFVYYQNDEVWTNFQRIVSDLLPASKDKVQLQLALRDLAALFAFAGTDANVAPLFDNAAFLKFRMSGPVIATRNIDLFQDSFAQSGATDVSDALSGDVWSLRDTHDVRVDMARDVNTGWKSSTNTPGDSVVFDITPIIPGVAITDSIQQIAMHYSLNMNPLFEAAIRENAPVTDPAGGIYGWDQHEGSISASQVFTSAGAAIGDRYFFDLPDVDFMYPGDVLQYYIRAEDDLANVTTMPTVLDGYDDTGANYNRTFTVRALPSYTSTAGDHPDVLFWNDFGRRGGEASYLSAFSQLGYAEGVHYDSYTTMGPSSIVSNGLGSSGAHGANAEQLGGYRAILYEAGDLSAGLISDGSNSGNNDKGDDSGVLTAWWNSPGEDRSIAHFGDDIVGALVGWGGGTNPYVSLVMNASLVDYDIRPTIGNQTAPLVNPSGLVAGFGTDFITYGGCLRINDFDSIMPGGGAVVSHEFMDPSGSSPMGIAGVYNMTTDSDGGVKQSLTFPYGLVYVQSPVGKAAAGSGTRAQLLEEILNLFGSGSFLPSPGPAVASPSARSFQLRPAYPNPFNPTTKLSFVLGREAEGAVRIYNLRGALVRTLKVGEFHAGENLLEWKGSDDRGSSVASGVYIVHYAIDGFDEKQKIVMVK